jgi:hypothetical protein
MESKQENQTTKQQKNKPMISSMIPLDMPQQEFVILEQMATEKNLAINQYITELIMEKIAEKHGRPVTFEEHGTINEKVTITLPKPIMDFYRMQAYIKGIPDLPESLIAFDVADKLKAQITGASPEDWLEILNLKKAFEVVSGREDLLLGSQE